MKKNLRWGVVGAGQIARVFCHALRFSKTGTLHAIASRRSENCDELSQLFSCTEIYRSYEELYQDPLVDAVYIANLNTDHAQCAIQAAQAGKHILVEKPITTTLADLEAMVKAAQANHVSLVEGFMYRFHPQINLLKTMLTSGVIGDIQSIEAEFGYQADFDPSNRIFEAEFGGGALFDVGCYTTHITGLILGHVLGETAHYPQLTHVEGSVHPCGVDLHAEGVFTFHHGISAHLKASITHELTNEVTINGTHGSISLKEPWLPSSPCRFTSTLLPLDTPFPSSQLLLRRLQMHNRQKQWMSDDLHEEIIEVSAEKDLFAYEIDAFSSLCNSSHDRELLLEESRTNLTLLITWREALNQAELNRNT